jgi:hypothetical protein
MDAMSPDREWKRPRRPARQFPADTEPAGVIADHARVDLTFERSRVLTGSVGGQPAAVTWLDADGRSSASP